MSTLTSPPIDPARFALALEDLSLASLHAKAAELRNSLYHLRHSNAQLQTFADAGDADCADAIRENEMVMERFRQRVELIKVEVVEKRSMPWVDWNEEGGEKGLVNGNATEDVEMANGDGGARETVQTASEGSALQNSATAAQSGSLSDQELQRRIMQQMEDADEEGGLHL